MTPDPDKKRVKVHLRCPACGTIFDRIFSVPKKYPPEKTRTAIKMLIHDRTINGGLSHECGKRVEPEIIYMDEIPNPP